MTSQDVIVDPLVSVQSQVEDDSVPNSTTGSADHDVQMEDVNSSISSGHPALEVNAQSFTDKPKNLSDTIKSRNDYPTPIYADPYAPTYIQPNSNNVSGLVKHLRTRVEEWVNGQATLEHIISKEMHDSITPVIWWDTLMDKLIVHPDCGKAFRGLRNNDDELLKQGLHHYQVSHQIRPEQVITVINLFKENMLSLLKGTFNGEKFATDLDDQIKMSDAITFESFKQVLSDLDSEQADTPIPKELLCIEKLSQISEIGCHNSFHDYFTRSLKAVDEIKEKYGYNGDELFKIVIMHNAINQADSFKNTDEIYKLFKDFLNAGNLTVKGYNKVVRENKSINTRLLHKNSSQDFLVMNKKEVAKIYNVPKPIPFEQYVDKRRTPKVGNTGGDSSVTVTKKTPKSFRGKKPAVKDLTTPYPCKRCQTDHVYGQHTVPYAGAGNGTKHGKGNSNKNGQGETQNTPVSSGAGKISKKGFAAAKSTPDSHE